MVKEIEKPFCCIRRRNMIKRIIQVLFVLICMACSVSAQSNVDRDSMVLRFHFKFDSSQLDLSTPLNKQAYACYLHCVDSLGAMRIDSVVMVTTSSPEGSEAYNHRLTDRRSHSIYQTLLGAYKPLSSKLIEREGGEAWCQLRDLVANDTLLSAARRARVLRILDAPRPLRQKKVLLSRLSCYRYLKRTHYPKIRKSQVIIYYQVRKTTPSTPFGSYVSPSRGGMSDLAEKPAFEPLQRLPQTAPVKTLFTVKTNLLYDAVTAVNFAVEVPIGDKWSVEVEDVFPWWHNKNKWAFQLLQIGAEGRYWFKRTDYRDVLTGQFAGFYGMGGKYDFQNRRKFCYQGEFWSVGFTYGYAMPLGKRFNLEFSLSVGLISTHYRHYTPSEDWGELVADPYKHGIFNYVGPTKAKISLIYPLFKKIGKSSKAGKSLQWDRVRKGGSHD